MRFWFSIGSFSMVEGVDFMGQAIEYIYTCFTRLMDFLSYAWDLLNAGIDFIKTSYDYIISVIHYLPLPVQGSLTLLCCIAVIFLIFRR